MDVLGQFRDFSLLMAGEVQRLRAVVWSGVALELASPIASRSPLVSACAAHSVRAVVAAAFP